MLGLFELLMVAALGAAWGFYELRSLRRERERRERAEAEPPAGPPPP